MGLACASCAARLRIRSGTSRESGIVPPYGYNSRKNTFLPPYSHAVFTSMGCTRIRRDYTLRLRECDIFSISPELAGLQEKNCCAARLILHKTVKRLNLFQGAVFMRSSYNGKAIPSDGKPIGYSGGELLVPDTPIIPFIEGDGTGRDIWKASRR